MIQLLKQTTIKFIIIIKNNSDITIVSAEISNKLPYGELKYVKKNQLIEFRENQSINMR